MQVSLLECKQSNTIGIVKIVRFLEKFSFCFRYSFCWKDNGDQETIFQEKNIYSFSVLSIIIFFAYF